MTSPKLLVAWVAGAVLLLAGSWIINNLKPGPGVSDVQYAFALILAFVLYLLAGFSWISVASAVRAHSGQ